MGKHFADAEKDTIQKLVAQGSTPKEIQARLAKDRRRRRQDGPDLTTVRRFVKGKTFKRSSKETRGRKTKLSLANLRTIDRVRDELITKTKGEREITWDEVIRKSRVPNVERSTAAKLMQAQFGVKARRPRAKLTRSDIDEAERKRLCGNLRKLPAKYWIRDVHLVMDN